MLQELKTKLDNGELKKSESKVAAVILGNPNKAIKTSIASLAAESGVSEPTVNRFCTGLGYKGFPDFKLHLAQSLAAGSSGFNEIVSLADTTSVFADKIFDSAARMLRETRLSLDYSRVTKAVDLLAAARSIQFCGLGASAPVALDAQNKFFRLGVPVVAHIDILMQRMSAAAMAEGDVLVIVSKTGRTIPLIETAQTATEAGATVIAITTDGSPLAKCVDLTLGIVSREDTEKFTPSLSRLAHLTLIDILATGVTLRRGPDFVKHLQKIKASLANSRVREQGS
jgi:RpiR family carbohydrate utilization transcriptional regulator